LRPNYPCRRIKSREVVSTREYPNLRDHGRRCERDLLRLVKSLQRKHGTCYAAEPGLRKMIREDTGHMPGLDTVRVALRRMQERGLIWQVHCPAGGIMPDGVSDAHHGTRLIVTIRSKRDLDAFRAATKRLRAGERTLGPMTPSMQAMFAKALRKVATDQEARTPRDRSTVQAEIDKLQAWARDEEAKGRGPPE